MALGRRKMGSYITGGTSAGDYTFGTAKAELMEIMAGELSYRLDGTDEWISIKGGESFNVPADSSFDLKVTQLADYCCSYL